MIIADTNVWSVQFSRHPDRRVVDWIIEHDAELWLSVIVIGEIRYGAELPKAAALRPRALAWLAGLEAAYASRTLSLDVPAAHLFGALHARPREQSKQLDLMLAAQAIARDDRDPQPARLRLDRREAGRSVGAVRSSAAAPGLAFARWRAGNDRNRQP